MATVYLGEDIRHRSTGGGTEPAWSPDGKELFYRSAGYLMAMPVEPRNFQVSQARRLLSIREYTAFSPFNRNDDVTRDGCRFVMLRISETKLEPGSRGQTG